MTVELDAELTKIDFFFENLFAVTLPTIGMKADDFPEAANRAIMDFRPDRPWNDPTVRTAWDHWQELVQERKAIIAEVGQIGVAVLEEPRSLRSPTKKPSARLGELLAAVVTAGLNPRENERKNIEANADEQLRTTAARILDRIIELDELVADARQRWIDAMAPYSEAEKEGFAFNRRRQQAEAARLWSSGAGEGYG